MDHIEQVSHITLARPGLLILFPPSTGAPTRPLARGNLSVEALYVVSNRTALPFPVVGEQRPRKASLGEDGATKRHATSDSRAEDSANWIFCSMNVP